MNIHISNFAPAWALVQEAAGVRIAPVRTADHHAQLSALMGELLDEIGDNESHPCMDILDLVSQLVEDYEAEHVVIGDAPPAEVLRHLMEQHNLTQDSLREELGGQSVVSDILNGRRQINVRQAKALATRFNVSPAAFI